MPSEEIKYEDIITIDNLFRAWKDFKKNKVKKQDLQIFERNLEDNVFNLFEKLVSRTYKHGAYQAFRVHDPKERQIHKAPVSDRILHHLLYNLLCRTFDKTFIYDSYSCRNNKGTHQGVKRLVNFTRKVSRNYTKPCYSLKFDIKKFFASVDHRILLAILSKRIHDKDIIWLLGQVINSFQPETGKGIPLGNLTSQVFANIYLNELDQFVKNTLSVKYYIRYADDFIILSESKTYFKNILPHVTKFLTEDLKLSLHSEKIIFRNLSWGIDFLGYIILPHYILPRRKTRKRMFKNMSRKLKMYQNNEISPATLNQSLQSYLGYLSHANAYKLSGELKNQILFQA